MVAAYTRWLSGLAVAHLARQPRSISSQRWVLVHSVVAAWLLIDTRRV